MPADPYDLIVLGAGSAARAGAQKASQEHGAKVALIESTRWGGSCPNVACKPTKAYLVVAELVHDVNRLAPVVGIDVGPARADLARVKARKDALKKPQEEWVEQLREQGYDTYDGEAELVAADTVRVGDEELSAERILIATGSRTAIPPIEGIDDIDWIDHVSALELTELPESLLVVGGGPVGLELGQAFSRFGSQVTVVHSRDHLAPRTDEQAADELAGALQDEGIELVMSSRVQRVEKRGAEVAATIVPKEGEGSREVRVTHVLLASGRVPNVEALNLERIGIERHEAGDRRRRAPAHLGRRDLGRRRRDRAGAADADRPVPGAPRRGRHVHRRRARRRLLGATDLDLHGSRGGGGRAHRAGRASRRRSTSRRSSTTASSARSSSRRSTSSTSSSSSGSRGASAASTWWRGTRATSSRGSRWR